MWIAKEWKDYRVLDCSQGEKLEMWGPYKLLRPDPQVNLHAGSAFLFKKAAKPPRCLTALILSNIFLIFLRNFYHIYNQKQFDHLRIKAPLSYMHRRSALRKQSHYVPVLLRYTLPLQLHHMFPHNPFPTWGCMKQLQIGRAHV